MTHPTPRVCSKVFKARKVSSQLLLAGHNLTTSGSPLQPECSHSNCTLLCYLNGDLTMKKPKTGKTKMMTFLPWYSRFQNCLRIATCEIFTMRSSISPLENSLKIGKKILKSHIYICWFQQALFDHRVANFFGNFKLNTRAKKLSSSVLGFLKFKIA